MRFGLYLFIYFIISSCSSNKYENEAWSIAENSDLNKGELIQFLETYKSNEDRDKYAAACYLIRNLPGKSSITAGNIIVNDIDVVKADSLSASLEYSFRLRENSSYLKEYSFDQFLEYILPYRIAHEPLEYYWKWYCARHFYSSSPDSIREAADHINSL
ncbi:MAG: transglutaminase domain-containing protein, partial [Bacteroidales bacterium]